MNKIITIIPISSFNNSKTRLSPFLSESERTNLLKVMLKDIVSNIQDHVSDIIVTSKDEYVLNYAKYLNLNVFKEKEHEHDFLNNAISDAISYIIKNYDNYSVMILPADIPLFNSRNMKYILKNRDDFIISPSKGGGTNLLYINREYNYKPLFGAFSFFKHVKEAKNNNLDVNIYDSFYLSLDVNTPEDLGEILLHGRNTHTYNYLSNLNIGVESNHGKERLYVYRKNE